MEPSQALDLVIETPRKALPLLEPARYKGAFGGRGSGKSHFFAELLIEEHVANPDQLSVCIREYQRTLEQSVKRLLEAKINKLGVGSHFEIQDRQIKSRTGSGTIIFEGMQNYNAESIKSLEGFDRAWFAEAQRASQRSLDFLRPTIRKDGSELWFDWNPNEPTDPIDVLLRGPKPPPDSIVVEMNYQDNPWFPKVLREEMEYDKATDPDKYAHVWLGQYATNSERRVFRNWRIEEFETPADATLWLGADWGFAQDPTVLVRCFVIGRKLYVDYEAYQVGCEIVDTPSLFMMIPESEKWPMGADNSRPETISHVRKHGFPKIMPSVKGKGSVEDGVEFLKSHEIIVHPRCQHLADELTLYSYKMDSLTGRVLPVLEDRDNHCIDALRYALEATRRAGKSRVVVDAMPEPVANRW
jgi:phage terminase large subunit